MTARLEERLIEDETQAGERSFFGSPTIHINGEDLEEGAARLLQTGLG